MKRTLFAIGAIALAVSLLTITPLDAQTPSPSPSPSASPSPIAIRAGRLLDVKTGKIQKDVFVLIENHRIKSIVLETRGHILTSLGRYAEARATLEQTELSDAGRELISLLLGLLGGLMLAAVDTVIDATGRYVIPGGIDAHTHMEMPFGGTFASDTFETGTRAAADEARARHGVDARR